MNTRCISPFPPSLCLPPSLQLPPHFPKTGVAVKEPFSARSLASRYWLPRWERELLTAADDQNHMLPASPFLSDPALLLVFLSQGSLLYCVELRPETVSGGKKKTFKNLLITFKKIKAAIFCFSAINSPFKNRWQLLTAAISLFLAKDES